MTHSDKTTTDPEVERYLLLLAAQRSPRTVDAYSRDLAAAAAFLGAPIGTATTDDLDRWVAGMRANGLAASTIGRRVAAVRSYYRHQLLLGLRSDKSFAMQDAVLTLRGRAAWAHDYNSNRAVTALFQSLPFFIRTVAGVTCASARSLLRWRSRDERGSP